MQFDFSKQSNTDYLVLWKQLVNKLNTYDNIVSCKLFVDGTKTGIKVQFKDSTKEYTYIGKSAIVGLLKAEDKSFWSNLPF